MYAILASGATQITEKFGVNIGLLLGNSITFALVAFIIYRFVFKPVMAKSQERIDIIEKGLADAKEAETALQSTQETVAEKLSEATTEAMSVISEAKNQAKQILEKANLEASQASTQFLNKAQEQLEADRLKMKTELKAELSQLVSQVAQKAVKELLTKEQLSQISKVALEDITK
ncbi:MAG: F0F1 ATP synthase subunit B [Opitutales bacterium]